VIVLDAAAKNLRDLGLTYTQAKVYLAVLRESPCTFCLISKLTGIARSEIYRETTHLEQAGLVEKSLSRPTIIKAMPVNIALKNFVEHKKKECEEHIKNLENSLNEFVSFNVPQKKRNQNLLLDREQFSLIATKQAIIAKTKSMIEEAEAEICLRYLPRKICSLLALCEEQFADILRREVSVRIMTKREGFNDGLTHLLKSTININKNTLEVKYTSCMPCGLVIIDKKQLLVETAVEDFLSETPMLWTNNQLALKMLYQNFNNAWLQSPQRIELYT
jgi:sugar-specific transcriptional regulator TrmB